ncbi:MAG: SRPBCC family protein [Gammaproteobacteria bacterium]|nr:SRPBCC family protein [Gammaproteobacteria bacterium]MDE0366394.1 SRPBCC family protein [Gammaproteobacteria bacterium]
MSFRRARIINQDIVRAPAEQVWDVLTDWHNTHRLRTGESASGPLSVNRVELEGQPGSTPRTRVFHFRDERMGIVRETLLHQDDEAMHYYYNIEGIGPAGVRNYLATTDVDPITDSECQVTITARFDLAADMEMLRAKNIINAAHLGVIKGLQFNLEKSG